MCSITFRLGCRSTFRHLLKITRLYLFLGPDQPAVYISVTPFDPLLASSLAQWTDLKTLVNDEREISPRYTIYQTSTSRTLLSGWDEGKVTTFGDLLQLRVLVPPPDTAHPGDVLPATLGFRRLQPMDQRYHLFVHLYGSPTPAEGGPLWSQADARLCESHPTPSWSAHEIIVQTFALVVPEDVDPGEYTVVIGLYEPIFGTRLQLSSSTKPLDYLEMQRVIVTANP